MRTLCAEAEHVMECDYCPMPNGKLCDPAHRERIMVKARQMGKSPAGCDLCSDGIAVTEVENKEVSLLACQACAEKTAQTAHILNTKPKKEQPQTEREKFEAWWDSLNRQGRREALKRMPRETRMAWKNRNRGGA